MKITTDLLDAVKVQFLKPLYEEDFAERGMKAWLTKVEWEGDCYALHFDFTEFESENDKYLTESFYPNRYTDALGIRKPYYTAKEAGYYTNKACFYFGASSDNRDDALFEKEILEYLMVLEN